MIRVWILLFIALGAFASCDWRERKSEEGIVVSTRCNAQSPIDEFRAVTVINAKPEKIVALIENVSKAPEWIKYCKKGRLIKQIDAKTSITYTINDMPWPLTDRDSVVLNKKTELSGGAVKIEFEAQPDAVAKDESLIRIRVLKGLWLIEPISGSTKVTYQVLSDPGNLPAWMVNLGIVEQPFETMKNLKRITTGER